MVVCTNSTPIGTPNLDVIREGTLFSSTVIQQGSERVLGTSPSLGRQLCSVLSALPCTGLLPFALLQGDVLRVLAPAGKIQGELTCRQKSLPLVPD